MGRTVFQNAGGERKYKLWWSGKKMELVRFESY